MSSPVRPGVLTFALAMALVAGASGVEAAGGRAGSNDLLFGVGSISDDEAQIDPGYDLESEQGNTIALRWRLHFTDFVALETDLTHESGRVRFKEFGSELDSADTDTTFFTISGVVNVTRTAISPYVSAGFGTYSHQGSSLLVSDGQGGYFEADVEEDGSLFTAAAGVDGRTAGPLVWLFEVRYLDYSFDNFDDDWSRILYSGYIGIRF